MKTSLEACWAIGRSLPCGRRAVVIIEMPAGKNIQCGLTTFPLFALRPEAEKWAKEPKGGQLGGVVGGVIWARGKKSCSKAKRRA